MFIEERVHDGEGKSGFHYKRERKRERSGLATSPVTSTEGRDSNTTREERRE